MLCVPTSHAPPVFCPRRARPRRLPVAVEKACNMCDDFSMTAGKRILMAMAYAQEAELGYELHLAYWEQGDATEAAGSMLACDFPPLTLQRVWAQCRAKNTASVHVVERMGMRQERCQRRHTWM